MLFLMFSILGVVIGCNVRPLDVKCDEGWTPVQRKLSGRCLKIVETTNQPDCYNTNGWFSGVESYDELNTIMSMMKAEEITMVSVWVSIEQNCDCSNGTCPITEECKIPSVWNWIDETVTGREMFEAVKPQFLDQNRYGTSIAISTDNDTGLIDVDYLHTTISYYVCGKKSN
ncbi:unnamed protein product [Caenorhabditis angaria]|uniref:C-type lectin domain-containing protein n=1 Tax=Caenorhabditis angaria TaxID=860376 RepID=A0A9P1N442_9PELO|nr:unnamed protein product [Caenorhabditis angaria]